MSLMRRLVLPVLLLAGASAAEPYYGEAWRSLGAELDLHYHREAFFGAADHTLSHSNVAGFELALVWGALKLGFGTDFGSARPEGPLVRNGVELESRDVRTVLGHLDAGWIIPVPWAYVEPTVRVGVSERKVAVSTHPLFPEEYDLGGTGFADLAVRTTVPVHVRHDGVFGLGVLLGRRFFWNGGNAHYDAGSNLLGVSFTVSGWLIRGS